MIIPILILLWSSLLFSEEAPPLFDTTKIYTHPISSKVPLAQKYFDQGMLFFYGFNYDEAARSFQKAARLDPTCAICHWGEALALRGSAFALNDPRIPKAMQSVKLALNLAPQASPQEQAYIKALSNSYLQNSHSLKAIDHAFRDEMVKLSNEYPNDLDAKTLAANAKMEGIMGDKEVLKELNEVLAIDPNHPGALHYHIHTVEASAPIEEGLPSAKKLEHLVPFAGHLLHMPAHIYYKLGRYHETTLANQRAVKSDEDLFAKGGIKDKYFAGYYMHNRQFLIASLIMEGKEKEALEVVKDTLDAIAKEKPKLSVYNENVLDAQNVLVLQRFNNWDQILKEPEPKSPFGRGMWHFSRSLAFLSQNNLAQAKLEAGLIQNEQVDQEENWINTLLEVVNLNALAAIQEKEGNQQGAFATYQRAIDLEDTFNNADPPVWFMSSREAYGKALLRANKTQEANEQFQKDLEKTPNKMWSIIERQAKEFSKL